MPTPSSAPTPFDNIRETVDRYCLQRPQLEGILRTFSPLFEAREQLVEDFTRQRLPLDDLEMKRLDNGNSGVPLLADVSLDFLAPWIRQSAELVLPLLSEILPSNQEVEELATAYREQKLDILDCCTSYLARDEISLRQKAVALGMNSDLLHFTLGQVLGPPLHALARRIGRKTLERAWRQGFCPSCGSYPSVATLAKAEPIDLESLVGGGGQKTLHCSLCDTEWRFRRDACPACENADPGTREMIHVAKAKQERIEACTKCKAYFPCIDLREYAFDPDLTVAPLGLMHLSIIASEKGYVPLAPAPWNTFSTAEALS
jgi:FdhE protein